MLTRVVLIALTAAGLSTGSPRRRTRRRRRRRRQPNRPGEANDYSDPKTWLCRPGGKDACAVDETATVVAADGKLTRETWTADPKAPIDCFYVYPTVSTDPTPNSDMTADPAELNVVKQQFARFGSKCQPYAPMYRQVTLVGLRRMLAPGAAARSTRACSTTM